MYNQLSKGGAKMKNAIALGTFDGLHIAHRAVLDLPCNFKKIAVTFEKTPRMFFEKNTELLITFEEKCSSLKSLGFSEILPLDFNLVKDTQPLDFLEFLQNKYNPEIISCGFNYRFGKNGAGDTSLLKDFCNKNGITLKVCDPVIKKDELVSSTRIRNLLKSGEIEQANSFLYKPFSFSGEVLNGDKRGRTIGFPTINQKYPENLVKLKFGVYKTKVLFDGKVYEGVTNIGVRPTFSADYVISETYIKNFTGNLYGKQVEIQPISFLRQEKKFSSLEELKNQIAKDIK